MVNEGDPDKPKTQKLAGLQPVRVDPLARLAVEMTDPIAFALAAARLSGKLGDDGPRLHFKARRASEIHPGIDLLYEQGTRLDIPLPEGRGAFLIGRAEDGGPLGYALVLFVPDEKEPFFLQLAHLDKGTLKLLEKKGIGLGSRIAARAGQDDTLAITGASGRVQGPHLHLQVNTGFVERVRADDGGLMNGPFHTAGEFMRRYQKDEKAFAAYLKRNNFPSLLIPKEYRAQGRNLDPLALINKGILVLHARLQNKENRKGETAGALVTY